MTGSAPSQPADLAPAGRAAVDAFDPAAPTTLLITGGAGTGKTAVVTALRSALRTAGRQVLSRPRVDDPGAAVVVDDADLLDDAELEVIAERVGDPAATVIVASQPLAHRGALRRLMVAMQRENPTVALTPLPPAEIARAAARALGNPVGPDVVRGLHVATAGFPFLLRAALPAVPDGAGALRQAVRFALTDRLRRFEEPLLDTLLILSLDAGLGPDDVAAALGISTQNASAVVDRARACGLVEPTLPAQFVRAVHDGIGQIVGAARHHEVEVSVLRSQLALSTLTADLALRLAEHGLSDDRLASALTDFASRSHGRAAHAARLYRAAADAGATALSGRLADALALTGDCGTAGRLADDLLASTDDDERAAAVRIAASIAMHDGAAAQAAALFDWLGPAPDAEVGAAATVVAMATGDAAAVRAIAQRTPPGPPTTAARAARSVTEGLAFTLDKPYPIAVARLSQSIGTDGPAGSVLPDTPAALVTLAALHGGDPVRARSVIGRAVHNDSRADRSDAIFVTHRHRLLLGWTHLLDGQLTAAGAAVPTEDAAAGEELHRRDALWAAALRTGVARRNGDTGAMQKHWYAAMEVLSESSPELFGLLPLAELWIASARMRAVDQIRHAVDDAFARLAALGDPVLWSVPLHWAGVHAGILANAPDAVAPHGQALTAAAAHSPFAKVLATAGRTWLRVLAHQVDVAEVTVAARGLAQVGHTWDATRLAGQAALQTADPRVSQAMLQLARDLKQSASTPDTVLPLPETDGRDRAGGPADVIRGATRGSAPQLSDREREVAELLLQGLPYRDIGAQLFISAKTVEHHVARIRRRLGAESRSEMLSMLRAQLAPPAG